MTIRPDTVCLIVKFELTFVLSLLNIELFPCFLLYCHDAIGETIISPGAKQGLIPLVIPLTKNYSGLDNHGI